MKSSVARRVALTPTVLLALTGCVTLKPASRAPSADAVLVDGVPATKFGSKTCGAASLSAVMAFWGYDTSIEALDETLPKADNGGVLSLDLVLAAREQGLTAELLVGDLERLHRSLQSGQPLILMLRVLDAPGQSRDLYHYVIVDGFEPGSDLLRVNYGDGKPRWVSADRLSKPWKATGFATILIQPGDAPADSVDPIRYAVALEEAGRLRDAEAIYRRLLTGQPDSALLWVNLGNVLRERGLEPKAEAAYRRALLVDPFQPDALNNLAWLLLDSGGDLTEARALALQAVAAGGSDPYLALDTLGRIYLETEQCRAAEEVFRSALGIAPSESSARGWILFGLALSERDCGHSGAAMATLDQVLLESSDSELSSKAQAALRALRSR